MRLIQFLCLVIDRATGRELREYAVWSIDESHAQKLAARMYENTAESAAFYDWYIDSLDLSDMETTNINPLDYADAQDFVLCP